MQKLRFFRADLPANESAAFTKKLTHDTRIKGLTIEQADEWQVTALTIDGCSLFRQDPKLPIPGDLFASPDIASFVEYRKLRAGQTVELHVRRYDDASTSPFACVISLLP